MRIILEVPSCDHLPPRFCGQSGGSKLCHLDLQAEIKVDNNRLSARFG